MKNSSRFERAGARLARLCGPRDQFRLPCAQKAANIMNLWRTAPAPQSSLNPHSTHGRGGAQEVFNVMKCECAARAWTPGRVYAREARQERGGHAPSRVQRPPDRRRRQRGDDDVRQSSSFACKSLWAPGCMQTLFILMSWVTLSSPLDDFSIPVFTFTDRPKRLAHAPLRLMLQQMDGPARSSAKNNHVQHAASGWRRISQRGAKW